LLISQPKQILIAPLDWGLGHTARCIPIIRYIRSLGHNPIVACNASQRSFIEETFGFIDIIYLDGYNITYSKWNKWGQIGLLSQLRGIYNTISREHKWLMQLSDNMQLDGVISDNRYGLHHPAIPSVIMTHQLLVQSGAGAFTDRLIQKLHYKYLGHFHATWVVDIPGVPNLAGKLSHPAILPKQTKYTGPLSRFENAANIGDVPISGHLLILLSGPEPQRSILSKLLWKQALHYNGKVIFIEGSDSAVSPSTIPSHIAYYKRLTDETLAPLLQDAGMIICRSGYSTLMDLAALRKKAMLIPTPGQTEQEYLGKYLQEQGMFYCCKQQGFDLNRSLKDASQFPYHFPELSTAYNNYKTVIDEWIQTL
jgi:hypothetical protein